MAYKTLASYKSSVSGMLQGLNLNNVKNLNVALERAARVVCSKADIPDTMGQLQLSLYDGVTDYLGPTDIFGSGFIDIRPQGVSRTPSDDVQKKPIEQFDLQKKWIATGYDIAAEYTKGTGILRVATSRPMPKIELDTATITTGWVAAGTASGLIQDQTVFWQPAGALRIVLTGSGTGTLTKTIPATDITNYPGVAFGFIPYRATASVALTSIELRVGSDASNYYSVVVTSAFLAAFIAGKFDLASFDFSQATTVGSPVITKIVYVQIRIAHTATINNFWIGDVWLALPSPHTLYYGSAAIFKDANNNINQTITNDQDTIILTDPALVLYEHEGALSIAKQQGGTLSSSFIATINEDLNGLRARNGRIVQLGLYDLYRADNPSGELRLTGSYYE